MLHAAAQPPTPWRGEQGDFGAGTRPRGDRPDCIAFLLRGGAVCRASCPPLGARCGRPARCAPRLNGHARNPCARWFCDPNRAAQAETWLPPRLRACDAARAAPRAVGRRARGGLGAAARAAQPEGCANGAPAAPVGGARVISRARHARHSPQGLLRRGPLSARGAAPAGTASAQTAAFR